MVTAFPPELSLHEYGSARRGTLLFLHANSYSAKLYQPFLKPLENDYRIWAPDLPGHGESRWAGRIQHWNDLADYYLQQIGPKLSRKPIIGMGHSIGGILILIMAIKQPAWFSRIILLDPVLLPKRLLLSLRLLHFFSLSHLIPLARASTRRKRLFPSREAALEHYSKKLVFSRWQAEFLQAYVDTCLHPTESGQYQLACAPQLESSIYQSLPLNAWSLPKKVPVPALYIIGDKSDTVNQRGFRRLQRLGGNHVVKSLAGGHLFPFEQPEASMHIIKDFLAE